MQSKPFLVYKSSAGSGKTYTLVKEYLRIVLQEPGKIRHILAITFTNAAAAEMKERVIAALGDIASLAGKEENQWPAQGKRLVEALHSEMPLQPFEIIRRAQLALTLILHNYGDFSISTIDSFVHRLIRSFAFDLQLPLNFDVELDQDQLLGQAVDILVSRAGQDEALTRLLVQFIESRTDEEKSPYIEYDIANMARTLMDEKGGVFVERLRHINLDDFGKIHAELEKQISRFEEEVAGLAKEAVKLLDDNAIADKDFFQGNRGLPGYFRALAQGLVATRIQPNSYVVKTIEEDKWTAGKADAHAVAAIGSIKSKLNETYLQIRQLADLHLETYRVQGLVKQSLFPIAVLSELEKVLNEIKSENALLHISDFNRKISDIVAVEPTPFIYERIGERYHHYMIDEFQDTSGLQWQNLLPLLDNALASGHTNLVVGDGKQAIYRWRNGDVEQFASLPQIPQGIHSPARDQWQATLQRNYQPMNLDTNYRSCAQIVDFNNRFFGFAQNVLPPSLQAVYEGQQQKWRSDKPGGYVELVFAQPGKEDDYDQQVLQQILLTIRDLQQKNHPLSDITILCRANSQASNVARHLLEEGLNVISSESLLLIQSPRVNFMTIVMKMLHDPTDAVSLTGFLQYLSKSGLLRQPLHQLLDHFVLHPRGQHHDLLPEAEKLLQHHGIDFRFSPCMHMGLYELAETIVRSFFPANSTDPFVAFFMDVIYDYSNRFVASPAAFLEWWAENASRFSVVVPEGVDAVQVMTIHKSKGLQFPVVIYPWADMGFGRLSKPGQWVELEELPGCTPLEVAWVKISKAMEGTRYEPIWQEEKGKTMLDILNVVYVAFTRAVDKLFVISKAPGKSGNSENIPGLLHQFLSQDNVQPDPSGVFRFGENSPVVSAEGQSPATAALFGAYVSLPWTQRLSIRSRQLEKVSTPDLPPPADASQRGSRIHAIMEKIHAPGQVETVLEQLRATGQMDEDQKRELHQQITSVLNHPGLLKWYQPGMEARNECGMYDDQGQFFRADRVVVQHDKAAVIDYKTGEPYPWHKEQIIRYGAVLTQMGYREVEKYLVYLDSGTVELV